MPKKRSRRRRRSRAKRFRREAQKLIDAGELNPTDADAALDRLVKHSASATSQKSHERP